MRGCGNNQCGVSTGIGGESTFGSGRLDDHGFWENPCWPCAQRWLQDHPNDPVWPASEKHEKYLKTLTPEPEQDPIPWDIWRK